MNDPVAADSVVTPHTFEHVDTDAAGVVHFSRHLSLAETFALNHLDECSAGLDDLAEHGLTLVVSSVRADYRRSARHRDRAVGSVRVARVQGARFEVAVDMLGVRSEAPPTLLTSAHLTFAVTDELGTPVAIPVAVQARLRGSIDNVDSPGSDGDGS